MMNRNILFTLTLLLFLAASVHARDITLEWDPNTEPDIAGYKIYYKASSPELPLDGTGAAEGPSPVDVKGNTRATLKGLDGSKVYYFAVTAYNSAGYESSFSNIVASDWVPVPTAPESGTAVSGSSVQFSWTPAPSGIDVTYTLHYGTESTFGAAASSVTPPPRSFPPAPPWLGGAVATLLTVWLLLARRRRLARSAAVSVLCALLLASCGGGGGGGGGAPAAGGGTGGIGGQDGGSDGSTGPFTRVVDAQKETTHLATGLKPGTYYWKVIAHDGQKARESTTSTFTIQ